MGPFLRSLQKHQNFYQKVFHQNLSKHNHLLEIILFFFIIFLILSLYMKIWFRITDIFNIFLSFDLHVLSLFQNELNLVLDFLSFVNGVLFKSSTILGSSETQLSFNVPLNSL
jgi:hypothetical protein